MRMLERLEEVPGQVLDRSSYHADFAREYDAMRGVIWKLERIQAFREPNDPSWRALVEGDWDGALAVFERERAEVRAEADKNAGRGVELRRLRIVERPIGRYLQWEMHYLRVLAEEGDSLRVLDADRVRDLEGAGPLPEVVIPGDRALYRVRYDDDGTPVGSRRIGDPEVIEQACREIAELYAVAEPLLDYFHREIAPLPPPPPATRGS